MDILSFLTLEDRPTVDPRETIKWGDVALDALDGRPPLLHSGVRIFGFGEMTERRRLGLQASADRVAMELERDADTLLAEGGAPLILGSFGQRQHVWMLFEHGRPVRSVEEPQVVEIARAFQIFGGPSPAEEAMFVEMTLNPEDDPAFARADPAAMKRMVARLRKAFHVSVEPAVARGVPTSQPILRIGPSPAERVAAERDAFLDRGWPTAADLARNWGSQAANSARFTSSLRREKKLFGVWSTRDGGTYVHPDFQFRDPTAATPKKALWPRLPELLEALESIPGYSDDENDVDGGDPGRWRRTFWLYQPREELSARSLGEAVARAQGRSPLRAMRDATGMSEAPRAPADVFGDHPDAVIALARKDAEDDRARI